MKIRRVEIKCNFLQIKRKVYNRTMIAVLWE
jgi:hypothetical protein